MSDKPAPSDMYLADVLLLCTECGNPIKGRINTQQWIRVEFIGPEGECQSCYQQKKKSEHLDAIEQKVSK